MKGKIVTPDQCSSRATHHHPLRGHELPKMPRSIANGVLTHWGGAESCVTPNAANPLFVGGESTIARPVGAPICARKLDIRPAAPSKSVTRCGTPGRLGARPDLRH